MTRAERIRRCRLRDLEALFRDRYGLALPNADDGREDLHEMLLLASFAYNPERMMISKIAQWAPWLMDKETGELKAEAVQMIDVVNRTPVYLRKRTARQMGDIMRLTDQDRSRLGITTMKPFDKTDEELLERRKKKDADRKWRKRRAAKKKDREAWLRNCKSRTRPWGHPSKRRTWYRKRAKDRTKVAQVRGTGVSAGKLDTGEDRPVSVESQRRGNSRRRVAEGRGVASRKEQVERKTARG
jgi:hypothetical protein